MNVVDTVPSVERLQQVCDRMGDVNPS